MKNYLHFQQRVLMIVTFILVVNITASFSQARVQDDTVKAMQVTILPVINGIGDDDCWQKTKWQAIGQTWIPYGESVDIGDYSGKYKVAWSATENILYFLVEITDDKFVDGYVYDSIPGIGGGYYNDDILEVFLDENRSGGLHFHDDAENAFSYHIVINAPADGNTTYQCVVCDIAGPSVTDSWYPDYAGHFPEFAVKKSGNQYIWEFSLAVYDDTYNHNNPEASRVRLKEGKVMGLSLAYCDNDDPDENPKKRDNFFGSVWVPESAKNDHWKDADGYGTIMLISYPILVEEDFINPPLYDEAAHEKIDVCDIDITQLVHEMGVKTGEAQDEENNMGSLVLNEDNTHFLASRTEDDMTVEGLKELVDCYVKGTQVRQLMFSPNSMCVSYASEVWDPIWHGYNDLEDLKKAGVVHGSLVNALLLEKRGIDPYAVWIEYSRELGVSPWMSMRMNDVHNVDDPNSRAHSSFWKENPQFRRVTDRFDKWTDRAFDYGHKAVRDYHMALIRELFERYDFDGLELDWMRFGYHFRPGHEEEGIPLLTEFMTEVRQLADEYAVRRGHPIKIGVRVPSRPWTAKGLGMDAITWAKRGLINMLVVTPFWATIEPDMPIEKWKELLGDSPVVLAAGLEVLLRPYPAANVDSIGNFFLNNAEMVRGAAASLLHRGADRIYLFNYMISGTTPGNEEDFYKIHREAGSLKTATAHPRRHVVTYSDTWAPGEAEVYALPVFCSQSQTAAFQIHIGPCPASGNVRVFIGLSEEANCDIMSLQVRVNGELCAASESAPPTHMHPVVKTMAGFDVPLSAVKDGYNSVEVVSSATEPGKIVWVEIYIIP